MRIGLALLLFLFLPVSAAHAEGWIVPRGPKAKAALDHALADAARTGRPVLIGVALH